MSAELSATVACHDAIAQSECLRPNKKMQKETYAQDHALAKPRPPVEPVIVLELVYLDALAIVGRWRYQCHIKVESLQALWPGQTRPPE